MNLYSRSWGASRAELEKIAAKYSGKTYVEIKYNGEDLVLPYQVTGGWTEKMESYSYQDFRDLPHGPLSIIW